MRHTFTEKAFFLYLKQIPCNIFAESVYYSYEIGQAWGCGWSEEGTLFSLGKQQKASLMRGYWTETWVGGNRRGGWVWDHQGGPRRRVGTYRLFVALFNPQRKDIILFLPRNPKCFWAKKQEGCIKVFTVLLILALNELDLDYLDVKHVWCPSFMILWNNPGQSSSNKTTQDSTQLP